MKRSITIPFINVVLLANLFFVPDAAAQPAPVQPTGSGTSGDPYQVSTLANLYWVMTDTSSWHSYFLQTDNIDASSTSTWPRDTANGNYAYGFIPIGNSAAPFTGTYDGNYHYISGLYLVDQIDTAGFFGYTNGAQIKNLGVPDATVYVDYYAGALIGYCASTTVSNCYSTGGVLVYNYGGGLIGYGTSAIIDQCFSTCDVNSSAEIAGGFIGYLGGHITNSYCTGGVYGIVGDLTAGFAKQGGVIDYCYTTSFNHQGPGFANTGGSFYADFWNTETTAAYYDYVATGITSSQMRDISTFTDAEWDFVNIWDINSHINNGFPFLTWQLHDGFTVSVNSITTSLVQIIPSNIGFTAESGSVSLTYVKYDDTPPDLPGGAVTIGTYWKVSGASGGNVKLRLYYTASATSSFSGSPTIMHYTGGQWEALPTSSEGTDGSLKYVETTDYYSSFSPVTVGDGNAALPVELTHFTASAEQDNIELIWHTATEVDNEGWEVERAAVSGQPSAGGAASSNSQSTIDNPQWLNVGFVKGSGTSTSPRQYSYVDQNLSPGTYSYRLKQMDRSGAFKYSQEMRVEVGNAPRVFTLSQNYPNPFNPTTTIEFTIPADGRVVLKVYDIIGREVATILDENRKAGEYQQVVFDGSWYSSGVYFAVLQSGGKQLLKKMLLLK
jgi:hypothetical protein